MGTLILWAYIIIGFITWVIAYGICYKSMDEEFDGPLLNIIMSGMVGLLAGLMWPLVLVIFGIHRIATHKIGSDDADT